MNYDLLVSPLIAVLAWIFILFWLSNKKTRKNEKTTAFSPNKRTVPYPII